MSRRQRRPVSRMIGDWLLNLLAVAGSVCIVLVILGVVFNVSIMMFRTGSMSPTITAGSIALVREIPATELDEGDVVTVDRGEETLPVTHRVVRILDSDSTSGVVTFEMRGDANESNDPKPYAESTVSRVMFSVPGVAPVIQWFSNPYVLGGLTLGATTLVLWAFWPRRGDDGSEPESTDAETETKDGAHPAPPAPSPRTTARHSIAGPAVILLAASLTAQASDTSGADTSTATETRTAHGDHLRMAASGDADQMRNLSPGHSATWTVDVWAEAPEPGDISLDIGADGTLADVHDAMTVTITMCSQRAAEADCDNGVTTLIADTSLSELRDDGTQRRELATMTTEEERRLFVTATLSESAADLGVVGDSGTVRITATGAGDELSLGPDDPDDPDRDQDDDGTLPRTGIEGWQWLLLAGGLLVAVGATLVSRRRDEVPR